MANFSYMIVNVILVGNVFISLICSVGKAGYQGTVGWYGAPHLLVVLTALVLVRIDINEKKSWSLCWTILFILTSLGTFLVTTSKWSAAGRYGGLFFALFGCGATLAGIVIGIPFLLLGHSALLKEEKELEREE